MDVIDQEISEDLEQAFGDDINRLASDNKQMEDLNEELNQLIDAVVAIESFGMNPTAFGIMKTTNLLSGTSLDTLAMENFQYDKPGDAESLMALEALTDKIKAKTAEWSAKILSIAKGVADKVANVIGGLWTKISDQTKELSQKAWATTENAGRSIKAHPFKTVMAVVVAAAAVAGIIMLVASGMQGAYANESALQSFVYKVKDSITKIKWPLGDIVPSLTKDASKLTITINPGAAAKATGSAAELGWTQSAVRAVSGQLSKAWSMLKSSTAPLVSKVGSVASKLNDVADPGTVVKEIVTNKTGSKISGWASQQLANKFVGIAFWGLIAVITKLVSDVLYKAFAIVKETYNSLMHPSEAQPA